MDQHTIQEVKSNETIGHLLCEFSRMLLKGILVYKIISALESNGLVDKPHPQFWAQNFSKMVRLIHELLR